MSREPWYLLIQEVYIFGTTYGRITVLFYLTLPDVLTWPSKTSVEVRTMFNNIPYTMWYHKKIVSCKRKEEEYTISQVLVGMTDHIHIFLNLTLSTYIVFRAARSSVVICFLLVTFWSVILVDSKPLSHVYIEERINYSWLKWEMRIGDNLLTMSLARC